MCSGTDPRGVWNDEVKRNTTFFIAFILTLIFYFLTLIRTKVKKTEQQQVPTLSDQDEDEEDQLEDVEDEMDTIRQAVRLLGIDPVDLAARVVKAAK